MSKPKNVIIIQHNGFNFHKGDNQDYIKFIDKLQGIDINTKEAFDHITKHLDINSYIDFWVHEFYSNRIDNWNNRLWNSEQDSRWKWISYDYDNSFNNSSRLFLESKLNIDFDGLIYSIDHFLKNDLFKVQFFKRLMDYLNFGYTSENVLKSLEKQIDLTEKELMKDHKRWNDTKLRHTFKSENRKRSFMEYVDKRRSFFIEVFANQHEFKKPIEIISPSKDLAKILINGYELESKAIYFKGMDITIEVIANTPGQSFKILGVDKKEAEANTYTINGSSNVSFEFN